MTRLMYAIPASLRPVRRHPCSPGRQWLASAPARPLPACGRRVPRPPAVPRSTCHDQRHGTNGTCERGPADCSTWMATITIYSTRPAVAPTQQCSSWPSQCMLRPRDGHAAHASCACSLSPGLHAKRYLHAKPKHPTFPLPQALPRPYECALPPSKALCLTRAAPEAAAE